MTPTATESFAPWRDRSEASRNRWTVTATRPVSYDVALCDGILDPANPALLRAVPRGVPPTARRLLVIDSEVHRHYGRSFADYFERHSIPSATCVLNCDETTKHWGNVRTVLQALDRFGIDRRNEPIVAAGGGVLLDVVGFAGSLYRRGTPVVRVPTTLIGLVDAGIGVKTGVNFDEHKNRIGTYHAADRVVLDPSFLRTVGRRHLSNGLAEILKMALIGDRRLFDLLDWHGAGLLAAKFQRDGRHREATTEVLERSIGGMLDELQPNLWESSLERVVDYGHSFSPTLEMRALPELLHGEAVSIDMALSTLLAEGRGLVTATERSRVLRLMRALELPISHPLCTSELLISALGDTTRHRGGRQRLPLPVGIGAARFVDDVDERELEVAGESLAELAKNG